MTADARTTIPLDGDQLTARELDMLHHQKMREHHRHQRRVGTLSKMGRQSLSHSEYVVKLSHYMEQISLPLAAADHVASPRGSRRWLLELRSVDFRAYQAKLAGIDIADHTAFLWWFSRGDEQRYAFIRAGAGALRDEAEQARRHRRLEQLKKMREAGEI
jgi:hypothetical protein